MSEPIYQLMLDDHRCLWLQLCVKNNNGFFYTGPQRQHLLGLMRDGLDSGFEGEAIRKHFPKATWFTKYIYVVPATQKPVHLLLLGDETGVLGKARLGKRKEQEVAMENGYVVTWERPWSASMHPQAYALAKDAIAHMTKADKLLNNPKTRLKTLQDQLVKMERWKRRLTFLTSDAQHIVVDANVIDMMTDYTESVLTKVVEMRNINGSLMATTRCQVCEWLERVASQDSGNG